jgi:hypothetical protein
MWRRKPPPEVVDDWTTRALAGVEPRSGEHVKALIARGMAGFDDAEESAAQALQLAEDLGDASLQSSARDALGVAAFRRGDFDAAYEFETSRFGLREELEDPDLVHDLYLSTIPTANAVGRLDEGRRLANELVEIVADLTAHHRLHGAANLIELDELQGRWEAVVEREAATIEAVEANRDTPCVRNPRSLLVCAVARAVAGDRERSAELEQLAAEFEAEGHGGAVATPRARLAIVRGDLAVVEDLLTDDYWLRRQTWFALPAAAARLDALAILGNTRHIEGAFAPPGSYVEPFGLRALGVARDDQALVARADDAFRALGLDWHAAQTEHLRRLRTLALG